MHTFQGPKAALDSVSDLGLARMRRLSLRDAIPFGTRRYTVPPGGSGRAERIDDLELSRVVSGKALVEVAGGIADVDRGEAVLFERGETHVFHNRSTTEPLVIFSIFWMPRAGAVTVAAHEAITA